MKKYRFKLSNQRVIGPFKIEEVAELFEKQHLNGQEQCQHFPIGDWKPIELFKEFQEFRKQTEVENENSKVTEKSRLTSKTIKDLKNEDHLEESELEDTGSSEPFAEFKFNNKQIDLGINYEDLETNYKQNIVKDKDTEIRRKVLEDLDKTIIKKVDKDEIDKVDVTRLREQIEIQEIEDILVQNKETLEEENHIVKLNLDDEQGPNEKRVLTTDATQVLSITRILPSINSQLSHSEQELELKQKLDDKNELKRLRKVHEAILIEQAIDEGHDEDEIEIVEEKNNKKGNVSLSIAIKDKKKKGLSLAAALAFLAVFYFVFFDEEQVKVDPTPLYVEVSFPTLSKVENGSEANTSLVNARKLYATGTYANKALATGLYLQSLHHKYSGNEALGEIILTYAEIMDNAKNQYEAANTIFKYIQTVESKLLSDITIVTGTALFYSKIKKYDTGVYVVENFLRSRKERTPKLEAYYMNLLMNAGQLSKAKNVFDKLMIAPQKSFEVYRELAGFEIFNENFPAARSILEEGLKFYPQSVSLLINYAEILFKEESYQKLEEVLKQVEALNSERSPKYASDFYKLMGYVSAYNKMNELAITLFKKSLSLFENDDLRSTLASLEISGSEGAQNLILESKIVDALKKAKDQYAQGNLNTAYQFTSEALMANPNNIPVGLFSAELNIHRGIFRSAISTLTRLTSLYPKNNSIKKMLIETYIKSYRFHDAELLLSELGQTHYEQTPDFAILMGSLMEAKKNNNLALRWYERALRRNPLDDETMYKMSKILVRAKKFKETRSILSKAIMLDPKNSMYHALYAEILFEQDGEDTAIGYLRDILSEQNPDDPILISQITKYYFKTGQLKEFERYYQRMKDMPKKSGLIYEVLINNAELEGRFDDYIKYLIEYLKLNPGDLQRRMSLAKAYYDKKEFNKAIVELSDVKDLLESYPEVNYELAKVYISIGDIDKATLAAKKELELNPELSSSHYIMGQIHYLKNEYRDAVLMFEKSISIDPRNTLPLIAMAEIRIKQNYGTEAIDLLNRALKQDLSNSKVHKLLGDAYRAAGQRTLAAEKYEDYLKMEPAAPDRDYINALIRNLR